MIAIEPVRVLSTADGVGIEQRCRLQQDRWSGDSHRIFARVVGQGAVPATGVSGVRIRLTAVQSNAPSTVRVWSPGQVKSQPAVKVAMSTDAAAEVVVPVASDGTIALAGREYNGLIDSPCFTRAATADRTLTCLSCHALHQGKQDQRPAEAWADDQLQPRANGDQACLHCHEPIRARVTEHTHHAAGSSGSRCYNCHMPYTTYGLLKTVRAHRITSPDARVSRETGRPDACSLCHLDKPLAWTAGRLERWYGLPQPSLDEEARSTPAAVVWALTGDAQQRAVMADAFGRAEARAVSSEHWVGPVLATLLDDPYPAVRLIADRSLRVFSLPGTAHYDFLAPRDARMQASQQALAEWRTRAGAPRASVVSDVALRALTARRNDRRVALRE